jgi:alkanesulfonate monooxygenase SsuD/methylene tetrahydromethanopterin reductase-like flavin-dependent oxidoreductase (luciferase family)
MPIVLLDLAVGERHGAAAPTDPWPQPVSPAEAIQLSNLARGAGVTAIRILDTAPRSAIVDPTVTAAYLTAAVKGLGVIVDAATTHNAPYNLARRVGTLDRATDGRAGLVLHPGFGDEVSDAVTSDPLDAHPTARWAEYADVLTRLWDGFPAAALIGDQEGGVVVDDGLIRTVDYDGRFYRVTGPLDGPSSRQGRPVLMASDVDTLGWASVAAIADAVVVDERDAVDAAAQLQVAMQATDRERRKVRILGRRTVARSTRPAELSDWIAERCLDGLDLVVNGGVDDVAAVLTELVPALVGELDAHRRTLRGAFGLGDHASVRP